MTCQATEELSIYKNKAPARAWSLLVAGAIITRKLAREHEDFRHVQCDTEREAIMGDS